MMVCGGMVWFRVESDASISLGLFDYATSIYEVLLGNMGKMDACYDHRLVDQLWDNKQF